jgi:hypothetical protein
VVRLLEPIVVRKPSLDPSALTEVTSSLIELHPLNPVSSCSVFSGAQIDIQPKSEEQEPPANASKSDEWEQEPPANASKPDEWEQFFSPEIAFKQSRPPLMNEQCDSQTMRHSQESIELGLSTPENRPESLIAFSVLDKANDELNKSKWPQQDDDNTLKAAAIMTSKDEMLNGPKKQDSASEEIPWNATVNLFGNSLVEIEHLTSDEELEPGQRKCADSEEATEPMIPLSTDKIATGIKNITEKYHKSMLEAIDKFIRENISPVQ